MPNRVLSTRGEKRLPGLSFIIKVNIPFSISEAPSIQEKFAIACYNNNIDKSKKLRDFFYEALGVHDQVEFNRELNLKEIQKQVKLSTFDRIKKFNNVQRDDCFSEIMSKKIREFIEKNDKNI